VSGQIYEPAGLDAVENNLKVPHHRYMFHTTSGDGAELNIDTNIDIVRSPSSFTLCKQNYLKERMLSFSKAIFNGAILVPIPEVCSAAMVEWSLVTLWSYQVS
jgi:hypothetical protein